MEKVDNNIKKNILVVGDVILDTYIFGVVNRISPEAPVPVMLKKSTKNTLGGAANVAVNLVAAGQNTSLMGVVGEDMASSEMKRLLDDHGIDSTFMLSCANRMTTQKTRYLTPSGQQLLRMDEEIVEPISFDLEEQFIQMVRERIDSFAVIVVSDYLKGMITERLSQALISLGHEHNIPVLIDVKDKQFLKYKNAFLLKPNRFELKDITQLPTDTQEEVEFAAKELRKRASCEYVLVTLGGEGMMLVSQNSTELFPSIPIEVYDVTGAGDTAIAYLAASVAADKSMRDCVNTSNYAASIQVSKVGTSVVRMEEVERFKRNGQFLDSKLVTISNLTKIREKNKSIVFTNGCFDILHIGHIRYLKEVSKLGEILVVGVNSDESVTKLKGEGRPINSVSDRVEMLAAYPFIDYIVVFTDDTPIEIIKQLKPDILAKGSDYKRIEDVVGWDVVTKNGGKVVLADYIEGKSTSNIINKSRGKETN